MKSPEYLRPRNISMNMTPLIDVVFLLIIFFIVSSNLIQQDVSMELDLPAAETIQSIEDSDTKKITINVPQAGQVLVGTQPIDRQKLREQLIRWKTVWGDDTELRIRTNKDVPYGEIEPLLILATECGIWDVTFAVVERRP